MNLLVKDHPATSRKVLNLFIFFFLVSPLQELMTIVKV